MNRRTFKHWMFPYRYGGGVATLPPRTAVDHVERLAQQVAWLDFNATHDTRSGAGDIIQDAAHEFMGQFPDHRCMLSQVWRTSYHTHHNQLSEVPSWKSTSTSSPAR